MAHYISIRPDYYFQDEQGEVVKPFRVFEATTSFAHRMSKTNFQLLPFEDFIHILANRPDSEIRSMANNAGLDSAKPMDVIRAELRALAAQEDEAPEAENKQVGLDSFTVVELRQLASEYGVKYYGKMSREELVFAIEGAADEG